MKNLILPILYLTSLLMLISFATSCASTMSTTYKPNYEYLKNHKNQYQWRCDRF